MPKWAKYVSDRTTVLKDMEPTWRDLLFNMPAVARQFKVGSLNRFSDAELVRLRTGADMVRLPFNSRLGCGEKAPRVHLQQQTLARDWLRILHNPLGEGAPRPRLCPPEPEEQVVWERSTTAARSCYEAVYTMLAEEPSSSSGTKYAIAPSVR